MRRFIASMLAALGALSTALDAQTDDSVALLAPPRSAIAFGFAATLGPGWQIEGGEVAYVRLARGGPLGAVSIGARIGTFVDQGSILGGTKGFVFAPTLGARTPTFSLAQIGDDQSPTSIGFDVTIELSGYLASSSPLVQGSRWGAVALLPGLRAGGGNGGGPRYGLVVGPTLFFGGGKSSVRGFLGIRGEAPLARRERHP